MRIKALKSFPYAGKRWTTGDEGEIRDSHARTLIITGRARLALAPPPVALPVALPEAEPDAEVEKPAKRKYQRRDMTAED